MLNTNMRLKQSMSELFNSKQSSTEYKQTVITRKPQLFANARHLSIQLKGHQYNIKFWFSWS